MSLLALAVFVGSLISVSLIEPAGRGSQNAVRVGLTNALYVSWLVLGVALAVAFLTGPYGLRRRIALALASLALFVGSEIVVVGLLMSTAYPT